MEKSPVFNLRRITSDGKYVPEVDGLRFIAIASIVILHINAFFLLKKKGQMDYSDTFITIWNAVISTGNIGVPLFFVISGYILGLPFANQYINKGKDVSLSNYFRRRLTRLEPPYIIIMTALFFVSIYIIHKYSFNQLLPNLLASLTYMHNIVYGREIMPLVNFVAWSLEVEVQFYLLAPLLAKVFILPKKSRRSVIIISSLAFIVFQCCYQLPFRSIVDFIQFFLIGFLMADLKVSKDKFNIHKIWVVIIGLISFVMIFFMSGKVNAQPDNLLFNILLFVFVAYFNYLCLFQRLFYSFLSAGIISSIGGMCYSIYLLHPAIISLLGNKYLSHLLFSLFYANFIVLHIMLVLFVLAISTIYFILVERPCMNSNWPEQLTNYFRKSYQYSIGNVLYALRIRR
jgi:peptidoglycan/LPS O-acetylase OafA/YrhL